MLQMYMMYRKNIEKRPPEPKRIIFYRGMYHSVVDSRKSEVLMAT